MVRQIAAWVGALLIAGCGAGGWREQVRHQASRDYRCPMKRVEIVGDDGDREHRIVRVRVCGKRRVYRDSGEARSSGTGRPRWCKVRPRRRSKRARRPMPYSERVRRIVDSSMSEIEGCYDRAKRRDPRAEGVVLLRFIIGPDGRVVEAQAESEQLPEGCCRCVEDCFYNKRFPPPPTRRDATFHYPFVFGGERARR